MDFDPACLSPEERSSMRLRALYRQRGYTQYRMSKFEEYDLYAQNKDFLVSNQVITFTDLTGKLMALKPDVTLSILKNSKPTPRELHKFYYDEQVYRIPKSAKTYKEIRQVGLECIGPVDRYSCLEVLSLAAASLRALSEECLLDLSHMSLITGLIRRCGLSQKAGQQALRCFAEKNLHELAALCAQENVPQQERDLLCQLATLSGPPRLVPPQLEQTLGSLFPRELEQLSALTDGLEQAGFGDMLHIDFSVVNNMSYYDGLVFRGFLKGLSTAILAGGQYGKLAQEMGLSTDAIGFAVYLDLLEQLSDDPVPPDADILLLYGPDADPKALDAAAAALARDGSSVAVHPTIPPELRYGRLVTFQGKEGVSR